MNALMQKELLARLDRKLPHKDLARGVVQQCLAVGEEAQRQRLDVRLDATLSSREREARLKEIATGALKRDLDVALQPIAPLRTQVQDARTRMGRWGNLSEQEQGVYDVVALVDAFTFFVQRDLEGAP